MAMTVAHLADFDSPDENCSLIHGAPMSHGSGLYIAAVRAARRAAGDSGVGRVRARRSSSTCASTIPAAAPSSRRRWCSGWCRPAGPCPRNLRTIVYGGGPMYVDSLKKAMAAFGPIFVQIYGQGEAPMTITGPAPGRPPRRRRRGARLGRLRALRRRGRGARRRRHACRHRRDRRDRLPRRRRDVGLLEQPRRDRGDAAGRLAAHRRHGLVRRAGLPDAARPLQGRGDQRRQQHLSARGRGGRCSSTPASSEAGVVGAPDEEWGEVVVAFIVGSASPGGTRRALLERIARFKRPKRYEFVDELPKNSYGKVLKRDAARAAGVSRVTCATSECGRPAPRLPASATKSLTAN